MSGKNNMVQNLTFLLGLTVWPGLVYFFYFFCLVCLVSFCQTNLSVSSVLIFFNRKYQKNGHPTGSFSISCGGLQPSAASLGPFVLKIHLEFFTDILRKIVLGKQIFWEIFPEKFFPGEIFLGKFFLGNFFGEIFSGKFFSGKFILQFV